MKSKKAEELIKVINMGLESKNNNLESAINIATNYSKKTRFLLIPYLNYQILAYQMNLIYIL